MAWNPFGDSNFLDPFFGDLGSFQPLPSISFDDLALLLDDDDSLGSSSQHSSTYFQALAEDGDNLLDFSLLCGSLESIQSQEPHLLVEEPCFERAPLPALPLNDTNESPLDTSPLDTMPEQLFLKSSRRAVCDPCRWETPLLELLPRFGGGRQAWPDRECPTIHSESQEAS